MSPYERRVLQEAILVRKAILDSAPEGKEIEAIEIVSLDIIEPQDPAPQWLNAFHRTSREHVIKRELLLREGQPYRKVLLDESARNLRALPPLSVVTYAPIQAKDPRKVRILLVTKDVWSLRGGVEMSYSQGGLEKMTVVPSEINAAGLHHMVGLRYEGLPQSYQLGARYAVPRIMGTRYYGEVEWNLLFNRSRGDTEGYYGLFSIGAPLFSSTTPWAYGVSGVLRNEISRRYVNASLGTFDALSTPQDDQIPFQYRSKNHVASIFLTRSFGWGIKQDITIGIDGKYRAFNALNLDVYDPRAAQEFKRTNIPLTDHQIGPVVTYRFYTSDFITILDYQTFGLQEDIRVGHEISAKIYPVSRLWGASRNFLGTQFFAGYTWPLGDGFANISAAVINELDRHSIPDGSLDTQALITTPRTGFGRFIFSVHSLQRYRNYRNLTSFLGGDTNLRGYPSSYFVGKDLFTFNTEFRSRPVEILTAQVGFTLFHDVGSAYNGIANFHTRRSVGLGFRAFFPQLNRLVLRADLAAPLTLEGLPAEIPPIGFFIAFGQAFGMNPGG